MTSYSHRHEHSTTAHKESKYDPCYSSLSSPRERSHSTGSQSNSSMANTARPVHRDRHGQSHNTSKRRQHPRTSQPARNSERFQMDMAFRWWNDYLKPTTRRSGWLQFRSRQGTDWGFIPEQYTNAVPDAPPSSPSSKEIIVKHVLHHGQRRVHYAIGWYELYQLLHRYGSQENAEFKYQGPPLPAPELPRQVLTLRKPNVEPVVAVPAGQQQQPETPAMDPESELTQEERCNRMVMLGFWESRRTCLPSLYYEKFPNGMENAVL